MDPQALLPDARLLDYLANLRDLSIAYVLAFLIGLNREREDRSAGVRTFPLVAISACGFVQASEGVLAGSGEGKGAALQGIITGIGFIGGGAIFKSGSEVHGTATAAALWATGAIGFAAGVEEYDVAVVICLFTVVTLYILGRLQSKTAK